MTPEGLTIVNWPLQVAVIEAAEETVGTPTLTAIAAAIAVFFMFMISLQKCNKYRYWKENCSSIFES
jgi:hypothetical protein